MTFIGTRSQRTATNIWNANATATFARSFSTLVPMPTRMPIRPVTAIAGPLESGQANGLAITFLGADYSQLFEISTESKVSAAVEESRGDLQ